MNLKKLITGALLLAIGMILHQITPPIFFGVKPDFLLSMMFIAIMLSDDFKTTLILGITAGILTALTTGFPGGQLPNLVDKIITSIVIYYILKLIPNKLKDQYKIIIITSLGTLISGATFLAVALALVGLPVPFLTLFISAVLPATVLNTVITVVFYKAFATAQKHTALN